MSSLSYVEYMVSLVDIVPSLAMYLLDERTSGIYPPHTETLQLCEVSRSGSMCGYHDETSCRYLRNIRLKYHSLAFEHPYDKSIMNYLMIHIDGRRI